MPRSYTLEFAFVGARNLPVADLSSLASDPYFVAIMDVPHQDPDHPPPPMQFRSPTIRRTRSPEWDAKWRVAGVAADKPFELKVKLRDEDRGSGDDRLGRATLKLDSLQEIANAGKEGKKFELEVKKRRAAPLVYVMTYFAAMKQKPKKHATHASLVLKVTVIEDASDTGPGDRVYTVGPGKWSRHFSPLIGGLTPRRHAASAPEGTEKAEKRQLESSTFIGNKLQLHGPTPQELVNHYVDFSSNITALFKNSGIRGMILNRALKKQYRTIYSYDRNTEYGVIPADDPNAFAQRFLEMTSFGIGGRIFTYVITLDAEWRFTETGEQFSVDLLSKHTMHANAAIEIAISGEFFVRRMKEHADGDNSSESDRDPSHYELIIDNNSGTYRPDKSQLPHLQKWLEAPERLGALGRIVAMDGFDKSLEAMKKERAEEKKQTGQGKMVMTAKKGKRGSIRSLSSGELGDDQSSVSSEEIEEVLHKKEQEEEKKGEGSEQKPQETSPSTHQEKPEADPKQESATEQNEPRSSPQQENVAADTQEHLHDTPAPQQNGDARNTLE